MGMDFCTWVDFGRCMFNWSEMGSWLEGQGSSPQRNAQINTNPLQMTTIRVVA